MGFASFDKLMLKKNTSHNNPPAHTAPKQEKLWGKEYWKVMTTNFLLFFAFYLLTPLLPIYLDAQFDANKDIIGLVLSGYVVATFLVRPFSGFVVDTFNRKKVLTICFLFFFICFAGYIGAGIHAPVAELDDVAVVRNGFIYRLFGVYRGVLLVHIGEFDGLTHPELA